jgi:acetyltransferase
VSGVATSRIDRPALPSGAGNGYGRGTPSAYGALTSLLAPRSVAVIGASDRDGNLGGLAVGFLRKFGFAGAVWPVNAGRAMVGDLPCYPSVSALPGVPDLAILAVPAEAVTGVARECVAAGVGAAVAWAGGFAEAGAAGRALQDELATVCRDGGLALCGPNCIGIINTALGLTASFSSMLLEHARLAPGSVSMVSQSGGIGVMAHSRAQALGLGFRVTVSCGNEAVLGIPDFIRALVHDDGTRVIAVYTEGLSDPAGFVEALGLARARGKPVVVLKGGATEASGRAALAHTGRLAGADRTYDALFREHAVIRVYSTEELLDVCLQLASMAPQQLPAGDRVLITSFGGGSAVMATDQCVREGLGVPPLASALRERVAARLTPLSSALNPIDFTPGMMTTPKHRASLPAALDALADAPGLDSWLFMAAGFGNLAPELAQMFDAVRRRTAKPMLLTWQSMPDGLAGDLASRGIHVFNEHARAARTLGHLVRHAADLRHRIRQVRSAVRMFDWSAHLDNGAHPRVVSEDVVTAILEDAGLPVARGRLASGAEDAVTAAQEVGYPVAIKGISAAITHRAAAGLVALGVESPDAVRAATARFHARAAERGVILDGVWVQHMFAGERELLVTAVTDAEFGVMVGIGIGGGMTEIIDDAAFARAPLDADGAYDLIGCLRTVRRLPEFISREQREHAARFLAGFSALAAGAPWPRFTLEVNPLKLGPDGVAAVDGLLIIE